MAKLNPLDIVDQPDRDAVLGRNLVRWSTPTFGYVDMYINPQGITISDKKSLTSTRTKAGFILQYAGEELTDISITGTTGSAGMEGINILEAVYRSEHIGFSRIAEQLDQDAAAQLVTNAAGNFASALGADSSVLSVINTLTSTPSLSCANQPFPSLASLAAAVEMRFQGLTYRGYFTAFSVTESASSPGIFEYQLNFASFSKLGVRRNFMPWHRQPVNPADSNQKDNFSFARGEEVVARADYLAPEPPPTAPGSIKNILRSRALGRQGADLVDLAQFAPIRRR